MVWSALISAGVGLGTSLLGSRSARKEADKSRRLQQEQFNRQQQFQRQMLAHAMQRGYKQDQNNEYIRMIEDMNRGMAMDERMFQLGLLDDYSSSLEDERQYVIDRQVTADREAARQRAFEIEQYLRNQRISQEERRYAIDQLEQAKAIARGEREDDLRRYYKEQLQAQQERDFMIGQYNDARITAQQERDFDLEHRANVMREVEGLQSTLREARNQLGHVPDIPTLSVEDITAETQKRTGEYLSDVDRAVDRVASQNEADLIRGGVDVSTTGTAKRGEVAARAASSYQDARQRAYDDALRYITGKHDARTKNVMDQIGRRREVLGEIMGTEGVAIDPMMSLRDPRSALDGMEMLSLLPSGVHSRSISSANNYGAPVTIGSGVSGDFRLSPGMAETFNLPSAAHLGGMNINSAIVSPYNIDMSDPMQSYMNGMSYTNNNMSSIYSRMYQDDRNRYADASSNFGESLAEGIGDFTSWWSSRGQPNHDAHNHISGDQWGSWGNFFNDKNIYG